MIGKTRAPLSRRLTARALGSAASVVVPAVIAASCGGGPVAQPPRVTPAVEPKRPAAAPTLTPAEQKAAAAHALRTRGVVDRAARLYGEAYALDPRPEWLLLHAELLSDAWSYAAAVEAYAKLVALSAAPAEIRVRAATGLEQARAKAAAPAREPSDEELRPVDREVERLLAAGQAAQARALLQREVQSPSAPLDWFDDLGVLTWHAGEHAAAQTVWARARSKIEKEALRFGVYATTPIDIRARVVALEDGRVNVETTDGQLMRYDLARQRFLHAVADAERARHFVVGAGAWAWLAADGDFIGAAGPDLPPFAGGLEQDPETSDVRISAIALSPSGTRMAWAASDGGVSVVDLTNPGEGSSRAPLAKTAPERALGRVHALAFDAKGERVAAGHQRGVVRVLSDRGRVLKELRATPETAYAVAFTPSGRGVVSGHADGVRKWDLETRKEVAFAPATEPVMHVRPIGESTVEYANRLSVFRSDLPPSGKPVDLLTGPASVYDVLAVSVSPNQKLRATTHYKSDAVYLWDTASGKPRGEVRVDAQSAGDVDLSRDGRWFAVAGENAVTAFDLHSASHRRFTMKDVARVALAGDGTLLAAAGYGPELVLWDPKTGREVRRVALGESGSPVRLAFFPDGRSLAVQTTRRLRILDVARGQFDVARENIAAFDLTPAALAVTDRAPNSWGGQRPKLRVHRAAALDAPPRLEVNAAAPLHLVATTGWLAARDEYDIVVWDERGTERYRAARMDARTLALSRHGLLAVSEERSGELQVIDIAKDEVVLRDMPHFGLFRTKELMWVADGRVLVSAGHDGVAFWANQGAGAANGNPRWSRLATLRLTSDGWYAFTRATEERGFVTAGFSPSVLSDVIFDGHSGGLVWEGLRDDALLGRLFRCGKPEAC